VVHIADYKAEQGYLDNDPLVVAVVELSGARTIMAVPMLEHAEKSSTAERKLRLRPA
jgi:hypothetical protein